jgi:flagellar hook assembly protein FlgD
VIIEFSTPSTEGCTIDVLYAKGRLVRRMFSPLANAGAQRTLWDGKDDKGRRVPPAAYFVRLQAPTMDWFAKFALGR